MVPQSSKDDKSLGHWVNKQRKFHMKNELRLDRKRILDEIGFAWKGDGTHKNKSDDKLWHQLYEKLVEFKRKKGHCVVPSRFEQDKSLGQWVAKQRTFHKDDKLRLDRMSLLDEIGFAWKHSTLATRSSTTDVRGLVIVDYSTRWSDRHCVSHSRSLSSYYLCRIRIRKRSPGPAVWVSQTKHH
jgi:hypothetical protein